MVTIKDIAKRAGVSHATVSYVLNHKGNVSSAKIKAVEEAAREMGYQLNSAASSLRSGTTRLIAVVIPQMNSRAYSSFYSAARTVAIENGYETALYVTGNDPEVENKIIIDIASSRVAGVVAVSSLPNPEKAYALLTKSGVRVVFSERVKMSGDGIYFDMKAASDAIISKICELIKSGVEVNSIALITNMLSYPNERYFKERFEKKLTSLLPAVRIRHTECVPRHYSRISFRFFHKGSDPEIIVTTSEEAAREVLKAEEFFAPERKKIIFSLADVSISSSKRVYSYFIDYGKMGMTAARRVIDGWDENEKLLEIKGVGFQSFEDESFSVSGPKEVITFLASESPMDKAIQDILPVFEKQTGISVRTVFKAPREITSIIDSFDELTPFDIVRMDMALIDKIAPSLLTPLDEVIPDIDTLRGKMAGGLADEYCTYNGRVYTVPIDPSCLLLFYRKDLFENSALRKRYKEIYKKELNVPQTFREYKELSVFFDRMNKEGNIKEVGTFRTYMSGEFILQLVERSQDGKIPFIDTDSFSMVIDNFRDMIENPDDIHQLFWSNAVDAFIQGKCAMTIFYSNYADRIIGQPLSAISGKVGYSVVPGGRTLLGGGVLGLPRFSKKKESAAKFVSWLCSEHISTLLALLSGSSSMEESYCNNEIAMLYPWMSIVHDSFKNGVRRHIFTGVQAPFDQLTLENSIGFAALNVLQGVMSEETAIQYIEKNYAKSRGNL